MISKIQKGRENQVKANSKDPDMLTTSYSCIVQRAKKV